MNTQQGWITDRKPDQGCMVLLRLDLKLSPIILGFYVRDAGWRRSDGDPLAARVRGWMELRAAAERLDGTETESRGQPTLKQWTLEEAARAQLSETAVRKRFYRGHYRGLKLRRVNQRVVFVEVGI